MVNNEYLIEDNYGIVTGTIRGVRAEKIVRTLITLRILFFKAEMTRHL